MNEFKFTLSENRTNKIVKCLKANGEEHIANILTLQVMEQKAIEHLESIRVRLLQAEGKIDGHLVHSKRQGAETMAAH